MNNPNISPIASQPMLFSENWLYPLLKKITLSRNPAADEVTARDLKKALSHCDLNEQQTNALRGLNLVAPKKSVKESDLETLWAAEIPAEVKIRLASDVRSAISKLLAEGPLRPRFEGFFLRQRMQNLYSKLEIAALSVAGQEAAAVSIGTDLTTQLCSSTRQVAARLLIHANKAWGSSEMAEAIAGVLSNDMGYEVLHVDCSAYRSEGEAASLTGSKAYWSGSAPGLLTSQIHRHPRSVVVLHGADETLPAVVATIREPLETGFLTDHHGLENDSSDDTKRIVGRQKSKYHPTQVDCRQVVFIFTVSHGSDWLIHPNATAILGESDQEQRANLLGELQRAEREYRGERVTLMDLSVLKQLAAHHHILQPSTWDSLLKQAQAAMPAVLQMGEDVVGAVQWASAKDSAALSAIALCHQGAEMALSHTRAESIFNTLFAWVRQERLATGQLAKPAKTGNTTTFGLSPEAHRQWIECQQTLEPDPLHSLSRARKFLSLKFEIASNGGLLLSNLELKDVRTLADFTGVSGLTSSIPNDRLDDVAGHAKVKAHLREVVAHLKNPSKLAEFGVSAPRGVLLYGPPGTGKTLLARSLAGEASLPFINTSGTAMIDPTTLKRVFDVSLRNAPCVVFIDECEVLGKRGRQSHAHDAAINQLLAHIDGFESGIGVFYVLTTNRPDELDSALTRPGRIERSFEVGSLEADGRRALLSKLWPLLECGPTDLATVQERLVRRTSGLTGAELEQLRREIALRIARENTRCAPLAWAVEEVNRIQYGEASDRRTGAACRNRVALHEAGHALLHSLLMPELPLVQVSITPRNGSAGFVALSQEGATKIEETPNAVRNYISVLLAGRAAEILMFGVEGPSSGASSDLERATAAAMKAVGEAGLDDEFGCASLSAMSVDGKLPIGLHEMAANRARQWVHDASELALRKLSEHRACLDALTQALLARETLDGAEVADIVAECLPSR
jgi:cell division protease FtsH